jgi:Xaa-Pro aminopeptidase
MMHYSASPEQHAPINNKGLYLVDSGGQYPFGTTDLTRTISFGATTEQERRDYTLVLKAMINLSLARFRKGVSGVSLDTIARNILWQEGLDYNSGTGHGVGICLSVHEGPASISPRPNPSPIELNMFLTNEPGIYRQGAHGIRIENILRVVPDECNDFGEFYKFETLTLAPICKRPIDSSLLSKKEIRWLNDYHQRVYDALAPLCETQQIQWLKDATSPLS